MLRIDTLSYDDYDKVVRFLLEHHVPIKDRNKVQMFVVVEMSDELANQMRSEVGFDEEVIIATETN